MQRGNVTKDAGFERSPMLIIGLTGGIGSGKTAVSDLFAKLGVPVIDADVIARQVTEPSTPAFACIQEHFGADILQNGVLNRKKLRDIIFADTKERAWLESLLHPLIKNAIKQQLSHLDAPYCIVSIPLLLEVTPYSFIDRILVVDVDETSQIQRVMQRDNMTDEAVRAIMATQIARAKRLARADDVLNNDLELHHLEQQVQELHRRYLELSQNKK